MECQHEDFEARVEVNRLQDAEEGPVTGYTADIRVSCVACALPFEWIGVPVGSSPRDPRCSVDGTELRAPLRPVGSPPDFGTSGPGFGVVVHLREH